jgi:FAD:protein FMN transferase
MRTSSNPKMKDKISRRSFLMLPALAPLGILGSKAGSEEWSEHQYEEHIFHCDHILGTSLDMAVWTPRSAGSVAIAQRAMQAALNEIHRLSTILNTRDPESEISRFDRGESSAMSAELGEVLQLYKLWQARTGGVLSVRPAGSNTALNVDALGKAYIIDRAVAAARRAGPWLNGLSGLLLNIGGDIVVCGRELELRVADPDSQYDNADPFTHIVLKDGAVATSGTSARGAHFIDGRTGRTARTANSTSVIARDAVTANALATTLCIMDAEDGMDLVERTPGAEALHMGRGGSVLRTSGFSRIERPQKIRQSAASNWPMGYEVSIAVTLKPIPAGEDAPYLAAWVEDGSGKLVRAIVLWGSKAKYQPELTGFWIITGGSESLLYKVTRVTRLPGSYKIVWNGLDNDGKPVPKGSYRIVIETNRYHGTYAKQFGTINCNETPANTTLSGTTNFEPITIQYGPRPTTA